MCVLQTLLGSDLQYFSLVLKPSAVEVFSPYDAAAFLPVRYLLRAQHIFRNDLRIDQSLPGLVNRVINLYAAFSYQSFSLHMFVSDLFHHVTSCLCGTVFSCPTSGDDMVRIVDLVETSAGHHPSRCSDELFSSSGVKCLQ